MHLVSPLLPHAITRLMANNGVTRSECGLTSCETLCEGKAGRTRRGKLLTHEMCSSVKRRGKLSVDRNATNFCTKTNVICIIQL